MSDATTGLPQLPEGEYWRIKFSENIFGEPVVTIKRKRGWRTVAGDSWEMTEGTSFGYKIIDPANYESVIRQLAETLMARTARADAYTAKVKKLTGNYPPKKLNN